MNYEVIAIGASWGGLNAVSTLLSGLSTDVDPAIVVAAVWFGYDSPRPIAAAASGGDSVTFHVEVAEDPTTVIAQARVPVHAVDDATALSQRVQMYAVLVELLETRVSQLRAGDRATARRRRRASRSWGAPSRTPASKEP